MGPDVVLEVREFDWPPSTGAVRPGDPAGRGDSAAALPALRRQGTGSAGPGACLMVPPVVGKRYRGWIQGRGDFVGECYSSKGPFWEFKVEVQVKGRARIWEIGEVMAVGASFVGSLVEIPLDAKGGS